MKNQSSSTDPYEEEPGKILDDAALSRALIHRNDIFDFEKEKGLYTIQGIAISMAIVLSILLSSMQHRAVASDFYQKLLKDRMARFISKQAVPAQSEDDMTILNNRKEIEVVLKKNSNLSSNFPDRNAPRHLGAAAIQQRISNERISDTIPVKKPKALVGPTTANPAVKEILGIAQNSHDNDSSLAGLGLAFKKQGDRAKAFSAFKEAITQNPHNIVALGGLGDLFLQTGLLDSAETFYKAALAENPRIASVHNGLGSVQYYLSVMAENPNFTETRKISNPTQYAQTQYDSAIADYTRAIELDSSGISALTNRGVLRDKHGEHAAALEDYSLAIKIKPMYADAYSKRAATFKSLGRPKEAIADYTKAISLDSASYEFDPTLHFANAYFGRANVYYQLGNYEKAISDYDSTLAFVPNHSLAILNKARALGDARQYDSAIACYSRAINLLSPKEYDGAKEHAYLGRGLLYNQTSCFALAQKDFDTAISLKPDDFYAYFHRGNALKAQTKYAEAIPDFTIASKFPKLAEKACWRIAECYGLMEDKANALAWLRKSKEKGFSTYSKAWKQDKDLLFLGNDPEFKDLVQ